MQHVTSHGAPKITMDSRDRDYESFRRQAEAQGDGNPHVMGVQEPQRQSSTTNNTPIADPRDLSGDVDLGNINDGKMQLQILISSKPKSLIEDCKCIAKQQVMLAIV